MSTTDVKLSKSQREELVLATKREDGRIGGYGGINVRTTQILKDAGMIAKDYAVRDAEKRFSIQARQTLTIEAAKKALAEDDWQNALHALGQASGCQGELDQTRWYITDAGRKAVAE